MKLLVLDESYPHEGNLPGDMFVHVRVKNYLKSHDVKVISFSPVRKSLTYEGVHVDFVASPQDVLPLIEEYAPDCLLIHFFQTWMLEELIKKLTIPIVIWVHGYEAMGWYRRLFDRPPLSKAFLIHVYLNMKAQVGFRKLVKLSNATSKIWFVFNSKWMKSALQTDAWINVLNYRMIPNPVDTGIFLYEPKPKEQSLRVLLIRSFQTKKYANDVSVSAILKLSTRPIFPSMTFTIMGTGVLFDKILAPLRNFPNVKIEKRVLPQNEVAALHKSHGIFLCPTRLDSQGVSMCEAMASGLVPVTSNNSAIPEFVAHLQTGILTDNANEIAYAMEKLATQPDLFSVLSQNAAREIRKQCSLNEIIRKEYELIESLD